MENLRISRLDLWSWVVHATEQQSFALFLCASRGVLGPFHGNQDPPPPQSKPQESVCSKLRTAEDSVSACRCRPMLASPKAPPHPAKSGLKSAFTPWQLLWRSSRRPTWRVCLELALSRATLECEQRGREVVELGGGAEGWTEVT